MKTLTLKSLMAGVAIALMAGFVSCEKTDEDLYKSQSDLMEESPASSRETFCIEGRDLNYYGDDEYLAFINGFGEGKNLFEWWKKVKKFVKDHSGSHLFENCDGGGGCGPCAGLCVRFGIVGGDLNDSDIISPSDYERGYRVYSLSIYEHIVTAEEVLRFEFYSPKDFLTNNNLYIADTIQISNNISTALGKRSVIIYPGIYSVVYDENGRGTTIPLTKMLD